MTGILLESIVFHFCVDDKTCILTYLILIINKQNV